MPMRQQPPSNGKVTTFLICSLMFLLQNACVFAGSEERTVSDELKPCIAVFDFGPLSALLMPDASQPRCAENKMVLIRNAVTRIDLFWSSDFAAAKSILSSQYVRSLEKVNPKLDKKSRFDAFFFRDREWVERNFLYAIFDSRNVLHVIDVSRWAMEGYEGVITFNYDLVNENGEWKIANIVF